MKSFANYSTPMINLIITKNIDREYLYKIDVSIKRFLTMLNYIDANISSKNEKTIWISCYNFMYFVNVPKIMKYYGPIGNLWEGGYIGEGYIRLVKPYICQGFKKNGK